jgi:hypothetical protein
MCDYAPGQLILSHDDDDAAAVALVDEIAAAPTYFQVSLLERMDDRIAALAQHGASRPRPIGEKHVLLATPVGDEQNRIASLYREYIGQLRRNTAPERAMRISPNHHIALAAVLPPDFVFSTLHTTHYLPRIGLASARPPGSVFATVAVIDSGIDHARPTPLNVIAAYDVRAPAASVDDIVGHGTVVASIIDAVAPGVALQVYKVTDGARPTTEWDVLAGLILANRAEVINLSICFGTLPGVKCPRCGTVSHSVRSIVFENTLRALASLPDSPVIVAAAGNDGLPDLAYPARFGNVVAAGAVDSTDALHCRSNSGTTAADGTAHPYVFLAPGGQQGAASESVGSVTTPVSVTPYHGTSFAAAYVSGLAARCRSSGLDRAGTLARLVANADKTYTGYVPGHGRGIARA